MGVLEPEFGPHFGFTEDEVKMMLEEYGLSDKFDDMKRWYDGYTAFHIKLPFLELDYTASAKCDFGISHHSMDNQAPKKEHLMKSGISFWGR
ncbi:MAG: hypothetical protein LBU32_30245 [Clostridiales bacterium]|jgi:hypothetical protein|nr:hypothetical protein [Clostridiales bacterium]